MLTRKCNEAFSGSFQGATRNITHKTLRGRFSVVKGYSKLEPGVSEFETPSPPNSVYTRERGPRHSSRPFFVSTYIRLERRSPCGRSDATRPAPLTRLLRICTHTRVGRLHKQQEESRGCKDIRSARGSLPSECVAKARERERDRKVGAMSAGRC